MSRVFEGQLSAGDLRFAIIVSRFNSFITERLLAGAMDALTRTGADPRNDRRGEGPGLVGGAAGGRRTRAPAPLRRGDLSLRIIRGETPHFDYVAAEAAKGVAHVAVDTGVPVAFGVLTTNTLEQAIDRAGAKGGNKGFDAAMTAIEMANLLRALRQTT